MDIEGHYQKIITEIEQGHRALVRFNSQELETLRQELSKPLASDRLEKVLCLVEHSATLYGAFEEALIKLLQQNLSDAQIIFALNCARKHIIQARGQKGQRLTFDFLETLKKYLYSHSPEVVEWTLRTIDECGPQGIYFLQEFDKIKPPPWKWFNKHQRSVREIIEMLERRWRKSERA